jgi:hypothetical protein
MTLPNERTRAVNEMARAVMALAPYLHGQSNTVRVPRDNLRGLHALLRHYPTPQDLAMTAKKCPELWSEE